MTRLAVSFDPGVTHLGVAGISYRDNIPYIEFCSTYDIRTHRRGSLSADLLLGAIDEVELLVGRMEDKYGMDQKTLWVLEYQPPLATRENPGLVRQNTFVEAFIQSWLMSEGHKFRKVSPSSVKRHFEFPRSISQYKSNKQIAKEKVKEMLGVKVNDHVADCVLNAVYALENSHGD